MFAREEVIEVGRRLLEEHGREFEDNPEVLVERIASAGHFPAVHALARHAQAQLEVVLDLAEQERLTAAMPNVRTAYECGLRACWLAQSMEAPAAFMNREIQQRRKLAETLRQSASHVFRESADKIAHMSDGLLDSAAGGQARNFEQMCLSLAPGGHDAYAVYRAMSSFVHPSTMLIDQYLYLPEDAEDDTMPVLLRRPREEDGTSWIYLAVAATVWATRAAEVMRVGTKAERSSLRRFARELQVAEMLDLTEEAKQAEAKAAQQRRRAGWRGRRPRRPRAGK